MSLKTERMEIRLDVRTIERVDDWRVCEENALSRSEAVRRLIEIGLEAHTPEGFRLNNTEKLMTWMLSEILKNQVNERKEKKGNQNDLKQIELIQEAIYGGHFWALLWEMQSVMHNHSDDPKSVRAVVDILDMWSFIEEAYERLSDEEKNLIENEVEYIGKNPRFLGFDENSETEYMGIAWFLVNKMDRFSRFKGLDFNSHLPTVARYRKMAIAFEPMRVKLVGRGLSADEIIQLLKLA